MVARIVALCVVLLTACSANASVMAYGTDGLDNSFDLAIGQQLSVSVYLYETFDNAAETSILDDEGGLFSASVRLSRISVGPSNPAGVQTIGAIMPNPAFNESDGSISPLKSLSAPGGVFEYASLVESRDLFESTGVPSEVVSADTRRILLGTFTITAGSVVGETTSFRLEDDSTILDDTVTWNEPGVDLDSDIAAFNFSVTTIVPEPCSLSVFAMSLAVWRGRKARRTATRR